MIKRKPGRPKGTNPPAIKTSIAIPVKTFEKIEKDRGDVSRSKFLLKKAGYGESK